MYIELIFQKIDGASCQQLISRPFGRSGQELPVEYQVEARSVNFSAPTAKKAVDRGQDLGIYGNPW
jgi:hypothetical protein